jgi:S-adenosylmethionine decarboxylase
MDSEEVTEKSGISSLMPGAVINDWLFEPCGYSLNALNGPTHYTIHVTPEPACSFVSFATNAKVDDYKPLMEVF